MKLVLKRQTIAFLAAVLVAPLGIAVFLLGAHPAPEAEDWYLTLPVSDLTHVAFDPVGGTIKDLPRRIREWDGKIVMLEGNMYLPENAKLRPNEFLLIEPGMKSSPTSRTVCQFVKIRLPADKKIQPLRAVLRVYGQVHVGLERDAAGKITAIYTLDSSWLSVP